MKGLWQNLGDLDMLLIRQSLLRCHLYNQQIKRWMEECTYLENGHQGASGSRETWLAVLLPLSSFEAALIGFVPLWAEDRNCQCVQSCQPLTTVHRSLWCEWTNEWMNEWMKYWGQSSLFLTFTTAAWSHALMNNGNHLTWALCKLLFSLYISLSHLFSTINLSFLELLIFISLSFHLFPQIIF